MKFNLRLLYLYLFSFVGLLITVVGGIQLVDLGLKQYVFQVSSYNYGYPMAPDPALTTEQQKAQEEKWLAQMKTDQQDQKKREASTAVSMILIGAPLYLYHWRTIKKES
jgi:hypothetical protein